MRILHVIASIDLKCGGTSTVCRELAAAQTIANNEVSIAAYGPPTDDYATKSRVSYITLHQQFRPEQFFAWRVRSTLYQILLKHDVCHIHGTWESLCLEASRAAIKTGTLYIHSPHGMLDSYSLSVGNTKKRIALALGFRNITRNASAAIVSNSHELDCVTPVAQPGRTFLIPHGVNLAALDAGMLAPPSGPPIAGASPYVLCLARLHSVKGLDLLIRAFAAIASEFPQYKLVLAGPDFGEANSLGALSQSLGISARVIFPGAVWGVDKAHLLRDATCFVLLSEHENFGLSLAEAMACRCPVVASEECNFDDIARVRAGIIVKRNPEAAAVALRAILSDRSAAAAMGQQGRQLVETSFTWPAVAEQFNLLFSKLLKSHEPSRN